MKSPRTSLKQALCNWITSRLQVISLNRCVYTSIVFLLQFYLIVVGLKRLQQTIVLNEANGKYNVQGTIVFYIFLIVNSIVLTVIGLLCGIFRIGNLSHDDWIFGAQPESRPHNSTKIKRQRTFLHLWKQLPSICNLVHLASATNLLYADLILSFVRVNCGLNPIGDVFKTKFDFLIGEPLERIQNQNILKRTDDFSTTFQNSISIDLLNYILALVVLTLHISKTFWYASKKFCLLIYCMAANYSLVALVSFYAFEIAYKIDMFGVQYQLYNNTLLSVVYFCSMFVKYVAIWLCATVGYQAYETSKQKFELGMLKVLSKSQISNNNNDNSPTSHINTRMPSKLCKKKNIFLIILFLTYCILRTLYLVDIFLIYKHVADKFLLISFSIEILCILFWLILMITFLAESKWPFKFSLMYKLTKWKYVNDEHSKRPYDKTGSFRSSTEHLYVRDDSLLNQSIDQSSQATSSSLINNKQNISVISGHFDETKCYDDIYSKPKRAPYALQHGIQNLEIRHEPIQNGHFAQRTFSHRLPKAISFDASSKTTKNNYSSVCVKAPKTQNQIGLTELFGKHQPINNQIIDSPTFSTTDSGRDSLNESPTHGNNNNPSIKNQLKNSKLNIQTKNCPIAKLDSHF
jgi:hypothetical protein